MFLHIPSYFSHILTYFRHISSYFLLIPSYFDIFLHILHIFLHILTYSFIFLTYFFIFSRYFFIFLAYSFLFWHIPSYSSHIPTYFDIFLHIFDIFLHISFIFNTSRNPRMWRHQGGVEGRYTRKSLYDLAGPKTGNMSKARKKNYEMEFKIVTTRGRKEKSLQGWMSLHKPEDKVEYNKGAGRLHDLPRTGDV